MLICLSGSYVEQELALHYGNLPPAFLPVGGKRLINLQVGAFAGTGSVRLTVPQDFDIDPRDKDAFRRAQVEIVTTDPELSLCQAIAQVLQDVPDGEEIHILFGDTLVELGPIPDSISDFAVVKKTEIEYPWVYGIKENGVTHFLEHAAQPEGPEQVVCGYFKFSNLENLRVAFKEQKLHDALNTYSAQTPIQLVEATDWYDFGHLTLFYKSKREMLVARAFNALQSDGYSITKTSRQTAKMRAEAAWFETLPEDIVLHAPKYIGRVNRDFKAGYRLEYLHLPTLSDMHVFGHLSPTTWGLVLSKCAALLKSFRDIRPDPQSPEAAPEFASKFFDEIIHRKTWSRLDSFCQKRGFTLDTRLTLNGHLCPPLKTIIEDIFAEIPATIPDDISFWHGDFFFGNLFYDFNSQRVIMVDPRGMLFGGELSQYGDYRYDLGKLAHSVLGGYDHILAGRAAFDEIGKTEFLFLLPNRNTEAERRVMEKFFETIERHFGLGSRGLYALAALMFFSMLPLHQEDPRRQSTLLASGLNLYGQMKGTGL